MLLRSTTEEQEKALLDAAYRILEAEVTVPVRYSDTLRDAPRHIRSMPELKMGSHTQPIYISELELSDFSIAALSERIRPEIKELAQCLNAVGKPVLTYDLELPGGLSLCAKSVRRGVSLRVGRGYSIRDDCFFTRFDVLFGADEHARCPHCNTPWNEPVAVSAAEPLSASGESKS